MITQEHDIFHRDFILSLSLFYFLILQVSPPVTQVSVPLICKFHHTAVLLMLCNLFCNYKNYVMYVAQGGDILNLVRNFLGKNRTLEQVFL